MSHYMRRQLFLLVLLCAWLGLMAPVQAVGTVVMTSSSVGGGVARYAFAWTSTAGGAVSGNAQEIVRGRLIAIQFVPAAGGTQPSDLYDVTLLNEQSVDLLNSQGANLSNATGLILQFDPPLIHDADNDLDLVVANAGAAKTGTVYLWVQG